MNKYQIALAILFASTVALMAGYAIADAHSADRCERVIQAIEGETDNMATAAAEQHRFTPNPDGCC